MHDAAIGVLVRDTTPYLDCKNKCQSTEADYFGTYFELVIIIDLFCSFLFYFLNLYRKALRSVLGHPKKILQKIFQIFLFKNEHN
jgi:hypothetical protein